jgi:anaerobic magnesium-protoporphyrin IX monomethyl ester cyclase
MGDENHGIGYMRSFLLQAGFRTRVLDLQKGKRHILRIIREIEPEIIGFSVIFQSHITELIELAAYLRKEGIKCHFTAGGHYASLRYNELFKSFPYLDSIVRFEGEYTILDLVKKVRSKNNWRGIDGLVHKRDGQIIVNRPRPAEKDLDRLPFPVRRPLRRFAFNLRFATIIAGRGCVHNCTFCNTQEYYHQMMGPKKRMRDPQMVVREMEYLHKKRNCSIFLFDDDDFPVSLGKGTGWITRFCKNLADAELDKKILWKINCRPDEVDEHNFRLMKKHGLFHVFIGIEDGTDAGLKRLNKHITSLHNLASINTIKKLKIGLDFGFMLFQPWTTFESLKENLYFLMKVCSDGYTSVSFNKLLPLYATKVESELLKDGRLKMTDGRIDYEFLQESMNYYYTFVMTCFHEWLTDKYGVVNVSKWARNYLDVYPHYFVNTPEIRKYHRKIRKIISESNIFAIGTLIELAEYFETENFGSDIQILKDHKDTIKLYHDQFKERLNNTMAEFLDTIFIQSFYRY